ncbi:MAG TPA: CAP domain-containing protein [Gaiellaceae bacterium]|nr:CAP domain-containing protein [Gaiellaceae bacterium]
MQRRLALPAFLVACACLLAGVGIGAGGASAASQPARTIAAADPLERLVLAELNVVRRAHGLRPLRHSRPLSAAADAHSLAMGRFGFFGHESRDGTAFWHRVKRFYGPRGAGWSVGENLLWSTPGLDARGAVRLWMQSPGHRRNILTARWREIGLSAVTVAAAPGVFGGRDVLIITTDFGAR